MDAMPGLATTSRRAARRPNVLVVDDKQANFVTLDAVLGRDHNMLYAASGPEAIDLLRGRRDIDVVLMDVQMPGMDGFETASRIKRLAGYVELPIIFVTATYREDPFVRRGYEVGGIDYFAKPFDPEVLRMKVSIYATFQQRSRVTFEDDTHVIASEELLRVGRKLSSMLESLPVGVLIADMDGRVCQTTEVASRILKGVGPLARDTYGEILGWWDADGRVIKEAGGTLSRAIHQGETSHSEPMEIRCVDGSVKTILTSASPLRSLDGQVIGAVVLIQDLTETRRISENLEERVTRLVRLGIELDESTASH